MREQQSPFWWNQAHSRLLEQDQLEIRLGEE